MFSTGPQKHVDGNMWNQFFWETCGIFPWPETCRIFLKIQAGNMWTETCGKKVGKHVEGNMWNFFNSKKHVEWKHVESFLRISTIHTPMGWLG